MKTIVYDLDHTICTPNLNYQDTHLRYGRALPIESTIESIRTLKEMGCKIIIFTARRMLTHDGDVEKIIEDVGKITEEWLLEHGVPYDELMFGKPYADYYVDDKAVTPDLMDKIADSTKTITDKLNDITGRK